MNVDLLVVGGGISGAAVAYEAAQRGLAVLLLEREDFAAGASSRSSKLVHGGLRYLKQGQIGLTRESLRAREQLLQDAPGLVQRLRFVMPLRPGQGPGRASLGLGLWLYDQLAGRRTRQHLDAASAQRLIPGLAAERGASVYEDATTDDARLTLRLLQEARQLGVQLHNRSELLGLTRDRQGAVCGAHFRDAAGFRRELGCRAVVFSAGARLGGLAEVAGLALPRLRPLRGSHLLFPLKSLPLPCAVAWTHPQDGRPVFAYPWQGALLVGTTDVDVDDVNRAPRISPAEQAYLLDGLAHAFPGRAPGHEQIRATWAGLRPVLAGAEGTPASAESREHLVQASQGVVALAGGKLTTFRAMAQAALAAAAPWLPAHRAPTRGPMLPPHADGRWGSLSAQVRQGEPLAGTQTLIGELRHSLQHEQVNHLDDLLLRRTRLGLLHRGFGERLLPLLRPHCQELLGWDAARFDAEQSRYQALMRAEHAAV